MLQTDELLDAWRKSPVAAVPPSEVVLVTDFDGTLAEIVEDPTQTVARPDALQALSRLVRQLADVIVLSSRTTQSGSSATAGWPLRGMRTRTHSTSSTRMSPCWSNASRARGSR
jgi:hypothetical protein